MMSQKLIEKRVAPRKYWLRKVIRIAISYDFYLENIVFESLKHSLICH